MGAAPQSSHRCAGHGCSHPAPPEACKAYVTPKAIAKPHTPVVVDLGLRAPSGSLAGALSPRSTRTGRHASTQDGSGARMKRSFNQGSSVVYAVTVSGLSKS